jgi:hypothetical protein
VSSSAPGGLARSDGEDMGPLWKGAARMTRGAPVSPASRSCARGNEVGSRAMTRPLPLVLVAVALVPFLAVACDKADSAQPSGATTATPAATPPATTVAPAATPVAPGAPVAPPPNAPAGGGGVPTHRPGVPTAAGDGGAPAAAGGAFAIPSSLPSGFPTALPSGFPTALPSGFPTALPSGFPTALPKPAGSK